MGWGEAPGSLVRFLLMAAGSLAGDGLIGLPGALAAELHSADQILSPLLLACTLLVLPALPLCCRFGAGTTLGQPPPWSLFAEGGRGRGGENHRRQSP